MKLYYSPTSPYVRKVVVTLIETGQRDAVQFEPTSGTPLAPAAGFQAKNPLTKVPALERDDGPTLHDSRVICRYLNDRVKAGLYPPEPRLWETLTLEATADGMLDAALLMTYEIRLRPEALRLADYENAQWTKITQACNMIEDRWMSHLAAPLDIGQIALGAALGYLDLRHDIRNWREGVPQLANWFARFSERESMIETRPPS